MKTRFLWLFPFMLCVGASECRLDDDLGEEEEFSFETLQYDDGTDVKGDFSGVRSKRLLVVRDVNEFTELWSDHVAGISPPQSQPTVGFGTDMLIAAFAGERPTGGYSITIEDVRENSDFIVIEIETETPGDNCAVTQAVTQPYHIVVVPDSEKTVQFSETTVEAPAC